MIKNKTVSIRFKQQAYRLLKNYPFKAANVFAEFIDNSRQSYKDNKQLLEKINKDYKLQINIIKQVDKIIITDNAAGISDEKIKNAFEPGRIPENNQGANEFGIGLKNASVWMSNYYTVETSFIGEAYSKKVSFDYNKVLEEEIEDLEIKQEPIEKNKTFTKVTLTKLREDVAKFNFDQIGKELASIYRGEINSGDLQITFLGKVLFYKQPEILNAPFYSDLMKFKKGIGKKPPSIKWKFDFDIKLKGKRIHGFVGILNKMQKNENGIFYSRRGRGIEGFGDIKMFPSSICGRDASSHQRKRIFGEFNFDGFEVSFDKGKLLAEEDAENLINLLAEQLKIFKVSGISKSYDFLRQAKELRVDEDIKEKVIIEQLQRKQKIEKKLNEKEENRQHEKLKYKRILDKNSSKTIKSSSKNKEIQILKNESIEKIIPGNNNEQYLMRYTIKKDSSSDLLYDIKIKDVKDRGEKKLLKEGIVKVIEGYINITCPFLIKNDQLIKGKSGEGFYELMEYLMISEAISKIKGNNEAHYIRDTLNDLLNT
jgi:hypothetical protein